MFCFSFSSVFPKVEILCALHFIMWDGGTINQFQACHSERTRARKKGGETLISLDPNELGSVGLFSNSESYLKAI